MLDENKEKMSYIAKLFNLPTWQVSKLIKLGYELPELEERLAYETPESLIKNKTIT